MKLRDFIRRSLEQALTGNSQKAKRHRVKLPPRPKRREAPDRSDTGATRCQSLGFGWLTPTSGWHLHSAITFIIKSPFPGLKGSVTESGFLPDYPIGALAASD
jgi:hypothetical protein